MNTLISPTLAQVTQSILAICRRVGSAGWFGGLVRRGDGDAMKWVVTLMLLGSRAGISSVPGTLKTIYIFSSLRSKIWRYHARFAPQNSASIPAQSS